MARLYPARVTANTVCLVQALRFWGLWEELLGVAIFQFCLDLWKVHII